MKTKELTFMVETPKDLDDHEFEIPLEELKPGLIQKVRKFRMRVKSAITEAKKLTKIRHTDEAGNEFVLVVNVMGTAKAMIKQLEAVDEYLMEALKSHDVGRLRKYLRMATLAHEQAVTNSKRMNASEWGNVWINWKRNWMERSNQAPYFWGAPTFRWIMKGVGIIGMLALNIAAYKAAWKR